MWKLRWIEVAQKWIQASGNVSGEFIIELHEQNIRKLSNKVTDNNILFQVRASKGAIP
jgi:hypothetical protein